MNLLLPEMVNIGREIYGIGEIVGLPLQIRDMAEGAEGDIVVLAAPRFAEPPQMFVLRINANGRVDHLTTISDPPGESRPQCMTWMDGRIILGCTDFSLLFLNDQGEIVTKVGCPTIPLTLASDDRRIFVADHTHLYRYEVSEQTFYQGGHIPAPPGPSENWGCYQPKLVLSPDCPELFLTWLGTPFPTENKSSQVWIYKYNFEGDVLANLKVNVKDIVIPISNRQFKKRWRQSLTPSTLALAVDAQQKQIVVLIGDLHYERGQQILTATMDLKEFAFAYVPFMKDGNRLTNHLLYNMILTKAGILFGWNDSQSLSCALFGTLKWKAK